MPRLLLTAALSCASACSLLVSFDDLRFEEAGVGGSGGQAAQGGAPQGGGGAAGGVGASPPGMGGNVGTLAPGNRVNQYDGEVDALAADGAYFYVVGHTAAHPLLVRLDQSLQAAEQVSSMSIARITAVAAKPAGVFFAGVATQAVTFEHALCNISISRGLFVAQWHEDLTCTVVREFGVDTEMGGWLRAADTVNNAVVVAGHAQSADLGCQPAPGLQHFIARYTGTQCDWASAFLLGGGEEGIYATAHTNTRVVVAGSYQGNNAGVAGCMLPRAMDVDAFVALLDRDSGMCKAVRALSGMGREVATALAVDGTNIYVAGRYDGNPDYTGCGEPLPDAGQFGATFVAKLTMDEPKPQILWQQGFATSGGVEPGALALLSSGDLRLAGNFNGDANFGGGQLDNATGFAQVFVMKLDTGNGQHLLSGAAPTFTAVNTDEDDVVTAMLPVGQRMLLGGSWKGDTPLLGGLEENARSAYVIDTDLQP